MRKVDDVTRTKSFQCSDLETEDSISGQGEWDDLLPDIHGVL